MYFSLVDFLGTSAGGSALAASDDEGLWKFVKSGRAPEFRVNSYLTYYNDNCSNFQETSEFLKAAIDRWLEDYMQSDNSLLRDRAIADICQLLISASGCKG